jgi:hypothetical protein
MANNADWLPKPIKTFDTFQNIFCKGVNSNRIAWKITASKNTALQNLKGTYDGYYAITIKKSTSTPNDFVNTKSARKALKSYIRKITSQEIKNNTNMTDVNRKDIGVPNAAASRTRSKISAVSPVVTYKVVASLIGQYGFTPKKKPKGQTGYYIKTGFYLLGETPPVERKCTQVDIIGKASVPVIYDESNKGMLFISYIRYINTNSKLGKAATIYYGTVS